LHDVLVERIVVGLDLTVYIDESGTHDKTGILLGSEVTTVAGYVATKSCWDRFTKRWRYALREYGVDVFHMSELAAWQKHEPYKNWTEFKRKRFLRKLIKIARDNTWFAIGGMVPTKDYESQISPDVKARLGSFDLSHPYHFCSQMLFVKFYDLLTGEIDSHLANKHRPNAGNAAFVFEQQEEFEDVAYQTFDAVRKRIDQTGRFISLTFC
jgi:hypothetical protein